MTLRLLWATSQSFPLRFSLDLRTFVMKRIRICVPLCVIAMAMLASNGVINLTQPNPFRVSNNGTATRWEPSSAVHNVSGGTWTTAWAEQALTKDSFASYWSNGWQSQKLLRTPTGFSVGDVNLAWDNSQSHYIFTAVEISTPRMSTSQPNVWFGHSTDALGSSWVFETKVFDGTFNTAGWDYPSIGVDGSGRIIIGAVALHTCSPVPCNGAQGYYSAVSTNHGSSFTPSPYALVTQGAGQGGGAESRVVGTNTVFQAFVPVLNGSNLPTEVDRYQSSDGITWPGSKTQTILTFAAPVDHSPTFNTSEVIWYPAFLTAIGYSNGLWAIAFPVSYGKPPYNNIYICTPDRGCGVNPASEDQFYGGASVSGDSGYWLSFYTYTAPQTLPLTTVAWYYAPGKGGIFATTNNNINPTSWANVPKCMGSPPSCYAVGDFQSIASNSSAGASTPFIQQTSGGNDDVYNSFPYDPQAPPGAQTPVANTIWFPLGSDVTQLAGPTDPDRSQAYPPGWGGPIPDLVGR